MRLLFTAAACLLLAACIDVDDFGGYWEKAYADPCIHAIIRADMEEKEANESPPEAMVRTLALDGHRFIMYRHADAKSKGGSLFRFRVENGEYISMMLNENMRDTFKREYPRQKSVTLTAETATINKLDAKSIKLLKQIAGKSEYWVDSERKPYNPSADAACPEEN